MNEAESRVVEHALDRVGAEADVVLDLWEAGEIGAEGVDPARKAALVLDSTILARRLGKPGERIADVKPLVSHCLADRPR